MLKVYITDLAAYNNGYLLGKWITLPLDKENLEQEINEVLQLGSNTIGEVTEEWFITDYEWENGISLKEVSEYEDIYALNDQLMLIQDAPEDKLKAMCFLFSEGITTTLNEANEKADDVRTYADQTMEDIAITLIDEVYNLDDFPSIIASHIDYKSIAYDLELEGNYTVIGNDVYEYMS